MKILITGGTGFIGSWSAAVLVNAGHEVRYLVRSPDKLQKVMSAHGIPCDDYVCADVTDADKVRQALQGCDGVIHTAAFVSTHRKDRQKVFDTNVGGTKNVIGQAIELGLKQIIHVSSVTAVYDPTAEYLTGDLPPAGSTSPYGHSKSVCENWVREQQDKGHPVTITYPASVIGPLDPALTEPHTGLLVFVNQFGMITSGGCQFVDVRDIAEAHRHILENLREPLRMMLGGHYTSWADLCDTLEKILGQKLRKGRVPGAVLRALGSLFDWATLLVDREMPISAENALYATRWVRTDDSLWLAQSGGGFRDHGESIRDALLSLYRDGHIPPAKAGHLKDL